MNLEQSEVGRMLVYSFNLGEASNGDPMLGVEISDAPQDDSEFEPNVKFVANMHGTTPSIASFTFLSAIIGDEVVGRELIMQLAEYILQRYGKGVVAVFAVLLWANNLR